MAVAYVTKILWNSVNNSVRATQKHWINGVSHNFEEKNLLLVESILAAAVDIQIQIYTNIL